MIKLKLGVFLILNFMFLINFEYILKESVFILRPFIMT